MKPYSDREEVKTLDDLLALHDSRFVDELYRRLLGREPDVIGRAGHLRSLRQGGAKLSLIWNIVTSDEGKSKIIELGGLDAAMKRYEDRSRSLFARWRFRNSLDYGRSRQARDARAQANQAFALEDRVSARLETMQQALDGLVDTIRTGAFPAGQGGATVVEQPKAIHSIRSRGLNVRPIDLPGKANPVIARLKI